jgi:nitrous-oxide reductase
VPEPRSPHGVDVSPDGNYLCIGGKLDPHVTVFSFEQLIKQAIDNEDFEGTTATASPSSTSTRWSPDVSRSAPGPLHTQFDDEGYGYISLFLESAVAKFSLGAPGLQRREAFQLVDKVPVHYNIGHLVTMEGDTVSPQGKYLVALNKWSIDRFAGRDAHPQNFQLIDLTGEQMDVLSDTPIGWASRTTCRRSARTASTPGRSTRPGEPDHDAARPQRIIEGEERIERNGNTVEVWMSVTRSHFKPDISGYRRATTSSCTSPTPRRRRTRRMASRFPRYNVSVSLDPGEYAEVEFDADVSGAFAMYCTEFCSALHLEMQGWMLVS